MADQNSTQTESTVEQAPTQTKAEIRAAELKAKREKREAEKAARKAANAEKRANGVIGTLHKMLQQENGATKKEVLAALTEKFPDRDPIGMATTVGIQLSRLQKKHGKIVSRKQGERGLVYGYELTVRFAPESSEGAPDKAALIGQVAETRAAEPVEEAAPAPVKHTAASKTTIDAQNRKGGRKR